MYVSGRYQCFKTKVNIDKEIYIIHANILDSYLIHFVSIANINVCVLSYVLLFCTASFCGKHRHVAYPDSTQKNGFVRNIQGETTTFDTIVSIIQTYRLTRKSELVKTTLMLKRIQRKIQFIDISHILFKIFFFKSRIYSTLEGKRLMPCIQK